MKVYLTNKDILNEYHFSEKEKEFLKSYVKNGGKLSELANYSISETASRLWDSAKGGTPENYLVSGLLGGATGALSASLGSEREKRKKSMLKGFLMGSAGGVLGDIATRSVISNTAGGLLGVPNVAAMAGGGLGGYLAAMHEEVDED